MATLLWWTISWQQTQIPVWVWYCEVDFSFLLFEQGNWWQSYLWFVWRQWLLCSELTFI